MSERIINITCPNCKHGVKHDTLLGTTTSIPPEDYPKINSAGRCWCERCQHGTYPTDDGMCTECASKGRATRLRPKGEELVMPTPEPAIEVIEVIKPEPVLETVEIVKAAPEVSESTPKKTVKKTKK